MANLVLPDAVLVKNYISGDESALSSLIERHQSKIYGFIYSKVNDINIIQKYAPQLKIEIYGGVDTYKLANQLLTGGADLIGSDNGYEIVDKYRTLRENTQVTPKPIRFD